MGAGLWPQGAGLGTRGWLCLGFCNWCRHSRIAGRVVVVMSCINTMMMNSRQDDEDRAERLAFAIEARSIELMQHGEACDPLDGFNICLAYGEATTNEKMVMAKLLVERKFGQAGILLDMITKAYWAKMADEMAEKELT
jgi:hypothetical protein